MKFFLTTVLVWYYVKYVLTLECYWNTDCKYKYFSSKTPYEIVRGDIRDSIVKPRGCEAVSVWAIMRHGKRTPSQKYAQDMKDILKYREFITSSYEIGNGSLCAQDVENIKNWKVDTDMLDKPYEISIEGYQELLLIGSRIKETFPELLEDLQDKDFLFLPGFGHHLEESARAFVEGFNHNNLVIENYTNNYQIVAPYSTCGKYQVEVRRNPDVYHQEVEYKKTADYLKHCFIEETLPDRNKNNKLKRHKKAAGRTYSLNIMKERVERKLGLNFTFTNENITAMYDLCRYTWNGISNTPSPWCAVFSVEDLQVLEYIDDLRHYYRNSYGASPYSNLFGQIPLADLLKNFEEAKNGNGRKIISYFTHATMMDMILVVLNLYKDENPLMGAYRDIHRKMRTTFLSTFTSNLIAVLNRCSKNGEDDFDYEVAFYWNEKPLLDLCKKGICSWQEFEDTFKPFLNATTDFCEFKWMNVD